MSKAEDKAKELFPLLETDKIGNNPYISYNIEQLSKQEGFIEGYHQAEKDLELTWEDIPEIFWISERLKTSWWFRDNEQAKQIGTQVFWEEVLKRFKQRKEINNEHI